MVSESAPLGSSRPSTTKPWIASSVPISKVEIPRSAGNRIVEANMTPTGNQRMQVNQTRRRSADCCEITMASGESDRVGSPG